MDIPFYLDVTIAALLTVQLVRGFRLSRRLAKIEDRVDRHWSRINRLDNDVTYASNLAHAAVHPRPPREPMGGPRQAPPASPASCSPSIRRDDAPGNTSALLTGVVLGAALNAGASSASADTSCPAPSSDSGSSWSASSYDGGSTSCSFDSGSASSGGFGD